MQTHWTPELEFFVLSRNQNTAKQTIKCIHDRSLLTKSSEVPNLSSSKDWMREIWTPISLWMPEHSIQVKIPRLVDSQVGSVEGIRKTWRLILVRSYRGSYNSSKGFRFIRERFRWKAAAIFKTNSLSESKFSLRQIWKTSLQYWAENKIQCFVFVKMWGLWNTLTKDFSVQPTRGWVLRPSLTFTLG